MGKKSRRKKVASTATAYRPPILPVSRPFEGMEAELELVSMREIVPAATMKATTTEEYGSKDFQFVTVLPGAVPAFVREDGAILVALQTRSRSGDAGHDVGLALTRALERAALIEKDEATPGPINLDVRDPSARINEMVEKCEEMTVHSDLGFWLTEGAGEDEDVRHAIEESAEQLIPTKAVPGVRTTFWHDMSKQFVRWVRPEDESPLVTALARLQLAGELTLGSDSRIIGAFRTCGLVIPVFEFAGEVDPQTLTEPVRELEKKLEAVFADDSPLTDDLRRARAGLISRQVSLR